MYGESLNADDPVVRNFWLTLESFTNEQRVLYLRFVWARSRLPLTKAGFSKMHTINRLRVQASRADMFLPVGHTCFFTIDLPRYSSLRVLREKLLYAITHCTVIDADNTSAARRSAGSATWVDE